ncbi:MAG: hypothetical protein EXQ84_06100 [Rhodospirillaceae bacterium]|nr:hypothetical protein [Rhodospirillaceae bacterium]
MAVRKSLAAIVLGTVLTGCGFAPLYGTHGAGSSPRVVEVFSKIAIHPLPDRDGIKLRQTLREQLQPQGLAGTPLYDLDVKLTRQVQELGIRKDATASRANLILTAVFTLTEKGSALYSDRVTSIIGYNILDDQYATVATQADAENRAIREISETIKTRLAVYFERKAKPAVAAAP